MPFIKNSEAKHDQQPINNKRIFVGRTNELKFFVENILKPEDPAYNIISISGQAGVGKSTLLTRFIDETKATNFKAYCLTALVDEKQTTEKSIMEKFAEQINMEGDFEKVLMWYNESLKKLQIDRNNMREGFWRRTTTDITSSVVKEIPILGSALEKGAELGVNYVFDELHQHNLLKDAERLEDPVRDLTKTFIKELNRLAETIVTVSPDRQKRRQRIILFFDTFEQMASIAAPWLLDYFLEANISNNIILVIAGRDPIDRSTPNDPKRWLPYHDSRTIYSISILSISRGSRAQGKH